MPIPEDLILRTPLDKITALSIRPGEHFEFNQTKAKRQFTPPPFLHYVPWKRPGDKGPVANRSGKTFGRLTVIGVLDTKNDPRPLYKKKFRWVVRCACGAYEVAKDRRLAIANAPHLMCRHCQIMEERKAGRGPWTGQPKETLVVSPTIHFDPEPKNPRRWLPYKKSPIPPGLRWSVWARDDFRCKQCGTRKHLSIDHVIPESKGGKMELSNLQTLCQRCNCKKGSHVVEG